MRRAGNVSKALSWFVFVVLLRWWKKSRSPSSLRTYSVTETVTETVTESPKFWRSGKKK